MTHCLRSTMVWTLLSLLGPAMKANLQAEEPSAGQVKRAAITIRGIYGGVPTQIFDRGKTLEDFGVNAIWIGSGSVTGELVTSLKASRKA